MSRIREQECVSGRLLFALLASLLFLPQLRAQHVLEIKNFKTADHFDPPYETQMKFLLTGARARPLENDQVLVYDAELSTFRQTGEAQLLVRAPECVYDQRRQTVNSGGPLHGQSADGKYSIDGEGFFFQQTNSVLFISNRVHTVVQAELLDDSGTAQVRTNARSAAGLSRNAPNTANAPGTSNPPTSVAAQPNNASGPSAAPIHIYSHSFDYDGPTGMGTYRENVRVQGTNLQVTAGTLTLHVPMPEKGKPAVLQTITAEQNVAMNYSGLEATGQRAVYSFATGLAHITGHPAWRSELRQGRGDELVIERTNRVFQALGHAWLRLPAQSFGSAGFLTGSNAVPGAPHRAATTNRFVEIVSDNYEFRTNRAVFRRDVRVREILTNGVGATLSCGQLTAAFAGSNDLQRLVAQTNVVIREEDKQFAGQRAVYTGTNGVLELTGKPSWRAGLRQGKGDLVRLDTASNQMRVRGNASMRLPADEMGQEAALRPPAHASAKTGAAPQRFADIFCEEYVVKPGHALFTGGVYATHPRMNCASETLAVLAPPNGERVLIAEQGVTFDLANEKGEKIHGTGDKANYTNNITSTLTNDLLTLIGKPARLVTATGTNENNVIIYDRAHNQLFNRGNYRVLGTAKGMDTNLFSLPGRKARP